jgi:hypothetical protein
MGVTNDSPPPRFTTEVNHWKEVKSEIVELEVQRLTHSINQKSTVCGNPRKEIVDPFDLTTTVVIESGIQMNGLQTGRRETAR